LMNGAALQTLIDFARKIPRKEHSEGNWAQSVIGWAARQNVFPGLTLSESGQIPLYQNDCCYIALAKLFDIPVDAAKFLFSHQAYKFQFPSPIQVAKRISQFMEDGHG
jgi:hypothetical protein